MDKSPDAFRTISEVAEWLDVPTHVLRFWESRFTQIKPVKRAGGRRYYRPSDMELLGGIKKLLHNDGLTIRGVQKILREEGPKHVAALASAAVTASASDDPEGSPMAVDVPAEPPAGEVVPFTANRAAAPDPGPDDALSRWPFADDPDDTPEVKHPDPAVAADADNATEGLAVGSSKPEAAGDFPASPDAPDSTSDISNAPSDAAGDGSQATDRADDASSGRDLPLAEADEPIKAQTAPATRHGDPAIGTAALSGKIAALPPGKLAARASDLVPLVDRMERLSARLSGYAPPDAD